MLFGWTTPVALADAGAVIAASLKIDFELHDSSYYGGDYLLGQSNNAEIRIIENVIEDDGEHLEAEFPDCPMLLLIDGEIPASHASALTEIRALRRLR